MNLILMILALIAAVLIEAAWPGWALLGQARPPLVLGLVLYYAWNRSRGLMLIAAGLGGVLSDSMNVIPLGYSALCLTALALVISAYREMVFIRRWVLHLLSGGIAGAAMILMLYGLLWLNDCGARAIPLGLVFRKALGAAIYGAVLVPLLFQVMEQADRMVGNLRMEAVP